MAEKKTRAARKSPRPPSTGTDHLVAPLTGLTSRQLRAVNRLRATLKGVPNTEVTVRNNIVR